MGSLSLLQGIFLTQGLNPGLLHCRRAYPIWLTAPTHAVCPARARARLLSSRLTQFCTKAGQWVRTAPGKGSRKLPGYCGQGRELGNSLLFFGTLHSNGCISPFLLCFFHEVRRGVQVASRVATGKSGLHGWGKGAQDWCTGITLGDRIGREVGAGFRVENHMCPWDESQGSLAPGCKGTGLLSSPRCWWGDLENLE